MVAFKLLAIPFRLENLGIKCAYDGVVLLVGVVVRVEEPLEPLQELEVVGVLALDEFLDLDGLGDVVLGERQLQDLEVLDVLVLVLGLPVDPVQGD